MKVSKTLLGLSLFAALATTTTAGDICKKTAKLQKKAAAAELKHDMRTRLALCNNLTDPAARAACLEEMKEEMKETKGLIKEQFQARIELCELTGGGPYDPVIDPANFSTVIDNPFLPFPVGATWTYESLTPEGLETITVTVLAETRTIIGVECVSVRDVVALDGVDIEDTIDWYAQDIFGNVWYFGEISFSSEDGYVTDIDGSWLSGVDGAKPGIVMLGDPLVGTTYRQEWLLNEAEDAGTVLADDVSVTIGLGTFDNCVETLDFLPPEPDAREHKFFASGIGFIHETKEGEAETVELISFTIP